MKPARERSDMSRWSPSWIPIAVAVSRDIASSTFTVPAMGCSGSWIGGGGSKDLAAGSRPLTSCR